MKKILIALALSALTSCLAVGGTGSESIVTYDELVEAVASLSDLLDRASYLAIAGFSAYDAEDQRVAAQELVNLFEGPGGPNYESLTAEVESESELGILAEFEQLANVESIGWLGSRLSNQFFVIRDVFGNTEHFLRLAYVSALEAVQTAYSLIGPRDAFRASYAFLVAARGEFDDPFLVAGIQRLQTVLPSLEAQALQGDSIQAALDFLPDGGTLRLESGTYRERLIITKSVTIVGAPQEHDGTGSEGGTVLEGVSWDPVILVNSDEPITVVLENLTIKGGGSAVTLFGANYEAEHSLRFVNVSFVDNGTALETWQPTQIRCVACLFDGNNSAIHAASGAPATLVLDACVIQGGSDPAGDIYLGAGELVMRDSELRKATGRGIVVTDTASMMLINNTIETSYAYAISVRQTIDPLPGEARSPCGDYFMEPNVDNLPLGTITGYGNTISGGVCPVSLLFLKDPTPAEMSVVPSQSIQAVIDAVDNGGTVIIGEGTYHENLNISKPITLLGVGEVTISPIDYEGPAIRIAETVDVVIQDIRIEDAAMGIETMQASCQLVGCSFRTTDVGVKAMTMDSDTVRIEQCTFTGENAGVGVQSLGSGIIEIKSCDFLALGTGTVLSGMTSVLVDDCTFTDCYDSILLASSVEGMLAGNHIDGSGGSGIRVAAVPVPPVSVPSGLVDDLLMGVTLTLIDNVIQNSWRWDISFCDTNDSESLTFVGSLLGSGNVIDGYDLLCPADYDWPEGFFADE